jgi:hypothetical protein
MIRSADESDSMGGKKSKVLFWLLVLNLKFKQAFETNTVPSAGVKKAKQHAMMTGCAPRTE